MLLFKPLAVKMLVNQVKMKEKAALKCFLSAAFRSLD
jgi:hypothetical protein